MFKSCSKPPWFDIMYWRLRTMLCMFLATSSVPSKFMANRRVPKFSWNNCAQSSRKTFMCPSIHTNWVLKYTKCHISTNLLSFLKLCVRYCQKLFALAPTSRWLAEKNRPSVGTLATSTITDRKIEQNSFLRCYWLKKKILFCYTYVSLLIFHAFFLPIKKRYFKLITLLSALCIIHSRVKIVLFLNSVVEWRPDYSA